MDDLPHGRLVDSQPDGSRIYKTRSGTVLPLRPIPAMVIRQLGNAQDEKPVPPVVEVTIGGGKTAKKIKEVNENDPDYLAALQNWDVIRNERIVTYIITRGVCLEPSKADIERLRMFAPGLSDVQLKFTWILELLEDDKEIAALTSKIMGQTAITEQGLRDAEATFPGDNESA
jgi:hypothetical protein